jgi:hypothetical protein
MSATPYGANVPGRTLPTGMAVASLVLGILGIFTAFFLLGGLLGLIAVILGIVALGKIKRGEAGGRGMAIGGIVTGVLAMLLALIIVVAVGSFFAENSEEFSNLADCLDQATTAQAEEACRDEFERNVNP